MFFRSNELSNTREEIRKIKTENIEMDSTMKDVVHTHETTLFELVSMKDQNILLKKEIQSTAEQEQKETKKFREEKFKWKKDTQTIKDLLRKQSKFIFLYFTIG